MRVVRRGSNLNASLCIICALLLFQLVSSLRKLLNLLEPIVYAIRTHECGQRSKIESHLMHLRGSKTPSIAARPFIGFDISLQRLDRGESEDTYTSYIYIII